MAGTGKNSTDTLYCNRANRLTNALSHVITVGKKTLSVQTANQPIVRTKDLPARQDVDLTFSGVMLSRDYVHT